MVVVLNNKSIQLIILDIILLSSHNRKSLFTKRPKWTECLIKIYTVEEVLLYSIFFQNICKLVKTNICLAFEDRHVDILENVLTNICTILSFQNQSIKCTNLSAISTKARSSSQGHKIWAKSVSDCPKWDKSENYSDLPDFSTFGSMLDEPKCTEIWSEKVPDVSHFGLIWPTFGPNLTFLRRLHSWASGWLLLTHWLAKLTRVLKVSDLCSNRVILALIEQNMDTSGLIAKMYSNQV